MPQLVDSDEQLIFGFVKKSAAALLYNLAQAADVMRDDWGPMRERLNRYQAKRFLEERRYDTRARMEVECGQVGLRDMAKKVDTRIAGRA